MVMEQGFCPLIKEECQGAACNFWNKPTYAIGDFNYRGCIIIKFLVKEILND